MVYESDCSCKTWQQEPTDANITFPELTRNQVDTALFGSWIHMDSFLRRYAGHSLSMVVAI